MGSAIARELSRHKLRCALVEAQSDVGMGTSKANTAIWHTGYDAQPGSLESQLLHRSYPLLQAFMDETGVPYEKVGGLLIAWTKEEERHLPTLQQKALANGDSRVHLLSAAELYEREPNLAPGARSAMLVVDEGILCTFTLPLALATQAVKNGVTLYLDTRVAHIEQENGWHILRARNREIHTRYLVNAAGLFADEIDRRLGHDSFVVTPRRGELIVFDKLARSLVSHVLLPVPTAVTKGVLISPTVYGNVLLGPTAEDLPDKEEKSTTEEGLAYLRQKGATVVPQLLEEEVTATYAGLRAATEHSDYQIQLHAEQRYVCVGGIRSTGVSGSLGIAEYVVELLAEAGLQLRPVASFTPITMPNIGEAHTRPYQSARLLASNADYGQIVCHCERVSRGELIDAMQATIPARNLDGLRRRTRALQGRCQGFNCHAAIVALMAKYMKQSTRELLGLDGDYAD